MDKENSETESRYRSEALFFDEQALRKQGSVSAIPTVTLERYRDNCRKRFSKEFRLSLVGDFAGKRILDVGCGEGGNSILLGKLGAEVVGLDVSQKAIELANLKAHVNNLDGRVSFLCSPFENAEFPESYFDIVWCDNVLHHLLPVLGDVVARLCHITKENGQIICSEPINLNSTLRRIRFLVPVHTEVTPGERPLERDELRLIESHFASIHRKYYSLFGRLARFVLSEGNYEKSGISRRLLWNLIAFADRMLLSVPGLKNLAGALVLWGTPGKEEVTL